MRDDERGAEEDDGDGFRPDDDEASPRCDVCSQEEGVLAAVFFHVFPTTGLLRNPLSWLAVLPSAGKLLDGEWPWRACARACGWPLAGRILCLESPARQGWRSLA